MEFKLVNPLCDTDWDRLVSSHPDAVFFHSAAWARVLCRTYAHEPLYLRCSDHGELAALVPVMEIRSALTGRRGVCLPFSDGCDPLLFNPECYSLVIDHLAGMGRERAWKYFEIRGGCAPHASATPAVAYYGHRLDLRNGPENLLARAASSVRRALRKAERSGLTVTANREGMQEFYRLHVRTRRRHGLPPQPVSFFRNIQEEIIQPGAGFIVLARMGSRPVAGAVFFRFNNSAIYKFGASDETFLEYRGNDLAMWEGISSLARHGCETLHFGRTSMDKPGLRRFKLAWGTVEERMEYFKFDVTQGKWGTHRENGTGFYNAVFGRLPLAVNCMAGAMIYPHLD